MANPEIVLVRDPRGVAVALFLVRCWPSICQVVDKQQLIEFVSGDSGAGAIVHRYDVFTPTENVQSGDRPDWELLQQV